MRRVAPGLHDLAYGVEPVYEKCGAGRRREWKNGSFWYGWKRVGDIAYGPWSAKRARLDRGGKADIKSGKLVVFTGPIKDQKGVERIPTGMVPSDKELLGMDWFVEGVIGTID